MKLPRLLATLRRRGDAVGIAELARRVLAASHPVPEPLARRVVSVVLDWAADGLPDPIEADVLRPPPERAVARIPVALADFAVVDLETTGLSAAACEILEIGAVRVRAGALTDEFETFVRPDVTVPARITRLTGIDDEMVVDAPPLPEALGAFQAWLQASAAPCFVAHNARFDHGFLDVAWRRMGWGGLALPVLCTRRLGRRLAPEVGRYSLDHLSAHFGVTNRARHRALGDARAAAQVLVELLSRVPDDSVGALLDLQERAPRPRKRRGSRALPPP